LKKWFPAMMLPEEPMSSAEAAAYCGEERESAASQWRDLLEMCQFLHPMIDLPISFR
jgi:hypothetical protein